MNKIDVVYCVLTYKNYNDLYSFIKSIKNLVIIDHTYRIVVVNAFSNNEVSTKIRSIAGEYDCDFIECENKGYGYGNNIGIEYILSNYDFKYLIVSNADISIKNISIYAMESYANYIIAPHIETLKKKNQNPLLSYYWSLNERILYYAFKNRNRILWYFGILNNKLMRYGFFIKYKISGGKKNYIFASHGSFVIFPYNVVIKLKPIYDINMFLMCEESDLARKAESLSIKTVYCDKIKVIHKEDGSMKLLTINTFDLLRKSFLYYYKKWNG